MTTYYKILRTVTPADFIKHPSFVELLKTIPSDGHVARDHFKNIEKFRITDGLRYACSIGILKRVSPYERVSNLESVKF